MPSTHRAVEVILVEKSSAGRSPIKFAGQTVEITHEPDTVQTGVDGHTSRAHHPSKIFWHGGASKAFANITHVKIVASGGDVLIDDELTSTYNAPKDVSGGVKFEVLREGYPPAIHPWGTTEP